MSRSDIRGTVPDARGPRRAISRSTGDSGMRQYLDSISRFLQERGAEELIVGVFLATLLAAATAGLHALLRRKMSDTVTVTTLTCLVANLLAMALTAGYARMVLKGPSNPHQGFPMTRPRLGPAQIRELAYESAARVIVQASDVDNDGRLSADEAAAAAARFIRLAEADSGQPIHWEALGFAIKTRLRGTDPRPIEPGGPAYGP